MKDRLKDHLEGWQFCENCGIKLYQKINGCSGMIGSILHLSGGLCNYWNGSKKSAGQHQLKAGVHVELANAFIVLHNHVLLKSLFDLCRLIYDFGFHLPRTPAWNLSGQSPSIC